MRRNILLVLLPLLALTSCINVEAKTSLGEVGKLTFSLAVVAKGCEFESSDLEVDMGKMTLTKPISVGQVLKERNFAISLKDCDGTAKAKVTMDGLPMLVTLPFLPLILEARRALPSKLLMVRVHNKFRRWLVGQRLSGP